jgi:hypothetical protein
MFLFIIYCSGMFRPHFLAIINCSLFIFTDSGSVSFEEMLNTDVWTRQITSVSTSCNFTLYKLFYIEKTVYNNFNISTLIQILIISVNSYQIIHVISGFRLEVNENSALMGCYAASSGNFLPKLLDKLSVRSSNSTHKKPRAA